MACKHQQVPGTDISERKPLYFIGLYSAPLETASCSAGRQLFKGHLLLTALLRLPCRSAPQLPFTKTAPGPAHRLPTSPVASPEAGGLRLGQCGAPDTAPGTAGAGAAGHEAPSGGCGAAAGGGGWPTGGPQNVVIACLSGELQAGGGSGGFGGGALPTRSCPHPSFPGRRPP